MDINKKTFIWVIVGLIVLRTVLMILAMNNVPFTDMRDSGFRPTFTKSYQPDEPQFYQMAKGLVSGKTERLVPNIGAPLVFAPLIYFGSANTLDELAPIVFIFQAFILFSLSIVVVAMLGYYLLKSGILALVSAFLFTVYPWILFGLFRFVDYDNAIPAFHYQLWIFILSDYLSAFWVYLSVLLIFKWFDNLFESANTKTGDLAVLALTSGAAFLTRIGNFWLILIIFAAFLYFKRIKNAFIYAVVLFMVYLPQLLFNAVAFGAPWIYGYRDPLVGASTLTTPLSKWFDPANLWLNFSKFSPHYYFWLFVFATGFFIITFIYGYKYLAKVNKNFAIVASVWFWSYLIFYWLFDESLSQLRYFLPAVPVFIYFFVASMLYFVQKIRGEEYV